MTGAEYQALAMRTARQDLTPEQRLINGAMGLCGESGEVIDLIKKQVFHGKAADRGALLLELGDVAWYLALTADALGVSLDDIFQMNVDKLAARYPDGFKKAE